MEDYKRKYNLALERARRVLRDNPDFVRVTPMLLEEIFPDHEESYDERMRKECLHWLRTLQTSHIKEDEIGLCIAWLEKQGEQKSADKIKPKFKVGDWVTSYRKVNQVVTVDEDGDGFTLDDDTYFSGFWKDGYHLWSITDAKDGDVLNSPSHHLIWIYKDNEHYHACVNMNYVTENVAIDGLIQIPTDVCPATKDEQTILFANIERSGYEWDKGKKELRKISQRMVSAEAKEALYGKIEENKGNNGGFSSNWSEEETAMTDEEMKKICEQCRYSKTCGICKSVK